MTYSDKLKDPRWQKKRLFILERAGWACQCCKDTSRTLHIHHLVYSKGEPWDAPDDTLECLCEECHEWRERWNDFWEGRSLLPTRSVQTLSYILRPLLNETAFKPVSDTWSDVIKELIEYRNEERAKKRKAVETSNVAAPVNA